MKSFAIIGFGFSGTMVAVNLIRKTNAPIELFILNQKENFNKGVAYSTYSNKHLLNVVASKMSAFGKEPNHYVEWLNDKNYFTTENKESISFKFTSRNIYGKYLTELWEEHLGIANKKGILIKEIYEHATDIKLLDEKLEIYTNNNSKILADKCVLATGNELPANFKLQDESFFSSSYYYQNPWDIRITKINETKYPILIVGNGLTMVDTVIGLKENGYAGQIISLSPNGFNIFPHIRSDKKYDLFIKQWLEEKDKSLFKLVQILNKHIKKLKISGESPQSLIDNLRPHTQEIWRGFTDKEKKIFMSRLRHIWGVARHRIPEETHEFIKSLQKINRLKIIAGKIKNIDIVLDHLKVTFLTKHENSLKEILVSRIINCTGPQTDILNGKNILLKNLLLKGFIAQDSLRLGIKTNIETFKVIGKNDEENDKIFTLGINLKGELWESTAINEIRIQAEKCSEAVLGPLIC